MALKEWAAFEAAAELLNPKNIKSETVIDIGSRYPLFTKMVLTDGSQSLVHILSAIPKATAKMIEAGLRGAKASTAKEAASEDAAGEKKKPGRPAANKAKAAPAKKEAEDTEDEENPYAGKSAKELYTLCKERGLKAKMKQPASVYEKMLIEDDQDAQDPPDPDGDDDWGDEEDAPEDKPATKKKAGRPAKKKAEPEPEEDDDDDWEI